MRISAFIKSLVIVFLFSCFFFVPSISFAQTRTTQIPSTSSAQTNFPAANTDPNVPNNLHNWTQNVMIETMLSLTCQLVGVDPTRPDGQCLGVNKETGKIGFLPAGNLKTGEIGGAIGGMNNMISMLYTPPLRTSDYFKDLASNFGISKHAFAANTGGTGFQSLTPLIGVWTAFRNIVYLFLVIIFVVIGLAIMLRVKIDPRTVMTIQNQIPKIIIGILAVTFSFAIAGFLIDMMWVIIYLMYGIFSGISPAIANSVAGLNPSSLQNQSVFGGAMGIGDINSFAANAAWNGSDIIKGILGIAPPWSGLNPFSNISITDPLSFLGWFNSIGNILGGGFNLSPVSWLINIAGVGISLLVGFKFLHLQAPSVLGTGPGFMATLPVAIPGMIATYVGANVIIREVLPFLIIYLIVFIALLTALFRLWFTLLMAYVQILLDVVLAPFWIIGGIIPGSPISLIGWLKDIGANLLAFPVVIVMFMLGRIFVDIFGTTQIQGQFVPPLIGNPATDHAIGSLIGVGFILMTPNVVNLLKQMLKAPKTDTGVVKAIGAGAGVFTGVTKSTVGAGATAIMGDPLNPEIKGLKAIFRGWQRRNG